MSQLKQSLATIILRLDGVLLETLDLHRQAYNKAFEAADLAWQWDADTFRHSLDAADGPERIKLFLSENTRAGVVDCAALFAQKQAALKELISASTLSLRPAILSLLEGAYAMGLRILVNSPFRMAESMDLLKSHLAADLMSGIEIIADDQMRYETLLQQKGIDAKTTLAFEYDEAGNAAAIAAGYETVVTPGLYSHLHGFYGAGVLVGDLSLLHFIKVLPDPSPRLIALLRIVTEEKQLASAA